MTWTSFDGGQTIGDSGSEAGRIVVDEEHALGARITLEEETISAPYGITCGIYGWMVHTCFAGSRVEAHERLAAMKRDLADVLALIPDQDAATDENVAEVTRAIEAFVERHT